MTRSSVFMRSVGSGPSTTITAMMSGKVTTTAARMLRQKQDLTTVERMTAGRVIAVRMTAGRATARQAIARLIVTVHATVTAAMIALRIVRRIVGAEINRSSRKTS